MKVLYTNGVRAVKLTLLSISYFCLLPSGETHALGIMAVDRCILSLLLLFVAKDEKVRSIRAMQGH